MYVWVVRFIISLIGIEFNFSHLSNTWASVCAGTGIHTSNIMFLLYNHCSKICQNHQTAVKKLKRKKKSWECLGLFSCQWRKWRCLVHPDSNAWNKCSPITVCISLWAKNWCFCWFFLINGTEKASQINYEVISFSHLTLAFTDIQYKRKWVWRAA